MELLFPIKKRIPHSNDKRNVPDEFDLMIKLLKWIDGGKDAPKPLEEVLVEEFNVSKTEGSLMRSGFSLE